MKYNSKTAAAKAFKNAVNNEFTERCALGSIGVQVYNLQEGSEYEVITEFGKDSRGRYYIMNSDNQLFGISSLNVFDFNELVERWERVQEEAKEAAEEFAHTARVIVEAVSHAAGYTCTWLQLLAACADLEAEKDNIGIYSDLGIIAGGADVNNISDGVEIIAEGAKYSQAKAEAKEYAEKVSRYNELDAEMAAITNALRTIHTEKSNDRHNLILRRSAKRSEQDSIYKRLQELDRRRQYFGEFWPIDEPGSEPETATVYDEPGEAPEGERVKDSISWQSADGTAVTVLWLEDNTLYCTTTDKEAPTTPEEWANLCHVLNFIYGAVSQKGAK